MKYKLTLFLLIAIVSASIAQRSKKNKREIKIGLNGNFALFTNPAIPSRFFYTEEPSFYYMGITPTVSFIQTKKRRVHEIEPQLWFNKRVTDAYETKKYYVALRYSLTKYFKKQTKHFRFRWGSSYQLFYHDRTTTSISETYRYSVNHFRSGIQVALVGQLEWNIRKRISLEMFTHLITGSASVDISEEFLPNPTPAFRHRTGGFDFSMRLIPVLPLIRLGVNYRI